MHLDNTSNVVDELEEVIWNQHVVQSTEFSPECHGMARKKRISDPVFNQYKTDISSFVLHLFVVGLSRIELSNAQNLGNVIFIPPSISRIQLLHLLLEEEFRV